MKTKCAIWRKAAGQSPGVAEATSRARCVHSLSLRSAAVFGRKSLSIRSWMDRVRRAS